MDTTGSVDVKGTGPEQVTMDKLLEDLRTVIADTEELLKATANQAGARIAAARTKVGGIAEGRQRADCRGARSCVGKNQDRREGHRRLRPG